MSFLIVKTSAIGDVIQTFPVVEYLRLRFPHARIDWVVERASASLIASHPFVDKTICIDTKHWRHNLFRKETWRQIKEFSKLLQTCSYDAVFDLQGNTKSAVVTALAKAQDKVGFSWESVPEKLNVCVTSHRFQVAEGLNVRQRYLQVVQGYFRDTSVFAPTGIRLHLSASEKERLKKELQFPGKKLMVAFGSKWRNKQLDENTLKKLLLRIQEAYAPFFVFIYSGSGEQKVAEALEKTFPKCSKAIGELSLPLWQALMWEMDGVMAMDSAALHLCGTTSTPSLSFFGPSLGSIYRPLGEHHHVVQGECPYGQVFTKRCPILRTCKTGACLRNLPVDLLFEQFSAWWGSKCS